MPMNNCLLVNRANLKNVSERDKNSMKRIALLPENSKSLKSDCTRKLKN